MNHSTIYKFLLVIAPLLLVGMYFIFSSGGAANPGTAGDGFVHPPINGNAAATTAMIRAQASSNPTGFSSGANGLPKQVPSGDNVADSYFHEIFVLKSKLESSASDTLSMRQLGRLLQDGHRMEEAISYYTTYLELRPKNKQVWLDLAASRASDKQWAEAEKGIYDMMKVYPGDNSAQYNLGAIAANSGDLAKARKIWTDLVDQAADGSIKAMAKLSLNRLNQNG
jgi:tetratricopeptide (TPR) repeat protein